MIVFRKQLKKMTMQELRDLNATANNMCEGRYYTDRERQEIKNAIKEKNT